LSNVVIAIFAHFAVSPFVFPFALIRVHSRTRSFLSLGQKHRHAIHFALHQTLAI